MFHLFSDNSLKKTSKSAFWVNFKSSYHNGVILKYRKNVLQGVFKHATVVVHKNQMIVTDFEWNEPSDYY